MKRAAVESVPREAGTQTIGTYIDRQQDIVVEWVGLQPIYEVCDREKGYEGERRHHEP